MCTTFSSKLEKFMSLEFPAHFMMDSHWKAEVEGNINKDFFHHCFLLVPFFFCTFVECITVSAGIRHQLFCFQGMNS